LPNAQHYSSHDPLQGLSKEKEEKEKVCPKLSEETALIIAEEAWERQGEIRDVISVSKLVKKHDGPGEIAEIIKTLAKYEPRLVRGSGIGHGSRDRSGGYPHRLEVCDPIDQDIAEIIKNLAKYGGERFGT
jgi:hypothetical protein